jgi:hypothetical protein
MTNEFFPGELFDSLTAVIANNSDANFVGTITGKSGSYFAVFSFSNGYEFEVLVGYTKAGKAKFPVIGVYH